jgi:hypothetical protein
MVYLIGVNHSCQYESPIDRKIVREERLAFQNHVLEITHKYNISLLAEEFSEEAKMKARVSESILEKLGKTEGIEQRFCDPTSIEKKENGIADNDDDRREQFWLSRIQDCKNKNVLFVCGFEHVESFRKKLITAGFVVEHESKHWFNFSNRELWDSDP